MKVITLKALEDFAEAMGRALNPDPEKQRHNTEEIKRHFQSVITEIPCSRSGFQAGMFWGILLGAGGVAGAIYTAYMLAHTL